MDAIKTKLAEWSKDSALVRAISILLAAMLILLAGMCISIYMRFHIQREYSDAAALIQEQTYQKLIDMTELFARVDDPDVDVRYKLIPELRCAYSAASALNGALSEGFGAKSAVLTQEQIEAFDAAFEQYAQAYRQGVATGLARADMAACIQQVQEMIDVRYAPPVDEEDAVVVIDADSGRVAEP